MKKVLMLVALLGVMGFVAYQTTFAATVETPDTPSGSVTQGGLPVIIPMYFSPGAAGDIDLPTGFYADFVQLQAADGIRCQWAYGMTAGYAQKIAANGTVSLETSNGITVTNGNIAFGSACQDTDGLVTGFAIRYSR